MRVVCLPNLLTECTTGTSPSKRVDGRSSPITGSAAAEDSATSCTADICLCGDCAACKSGCQELHNSPAMRSLHL